jgi:hypothetical protein
VSGEQVFEVVEFPYARGRESRGILLNHRNLCIEAALVLRFDSEFDCGVKVCGQYSEVTNSWDAENQGPDTLLLYQNGTRLLVNSLMCCIDSFESLCPLQWHFIQ